MTSVPARSSVWIVEDSALEAEMVRRILTPIFQVEIFTDGAPMLERLVNGNAPHVLVLDWRLPELSGIEICRFVRGQFDGTSLPILMLTVQGDKSDVVEGLSAGANDYLTKPYDPAELVARCTALYRTRQLSDDLRAERARLKDLLEAEVEAARQLARASEERQRLLADAQAASLRAEEANRAKDEFLATVSHELRTPLNAILGWVTLLRGGNLAQDRVTQALDTIDRNVRAQAQLIDDLLDVSRIISGKLDLHFEPIDVADIVHATVESLRPVAAAKRIEIRWDVTGGGARTKGDAIRLQQVVWNLLSNALKFTPAGGHVTLALEEGEEQSLLTVSDDGVGISKAALPHIFDPFRQGESSFARSHGGLGLGLAIVRHLVELHGGSVSVESAGVGRGATFTVALPRSTASLDSPERAPAPVQQNSLSGLNLLLVEDDEDGREAIATMLRYEGAHVDARSNVPDALRALDSAVPDVLVSDIGMPEEDGLSLLRKVRARDERMGGKVPALALTAFARAEDRELALRTGFDDYITKPVDSADLIQAVAGLAGRGRDSDTT
jgi:signal transduction histidine kinase